MNLRASLLLIGSTIAAMATEPNTALEAVAAFLRQHSSSVQSPVVVTATLKTHDLQQFLAFKLTNISAQPLQFYSFDLPWNRYASTQIVAVTTSGKVLSRLPIAGDPGFEKPIKIAPGETREGEYELSGFYDPNSEAAKHLPLRTGFPVDEDVIIAWSYPFSGAVILPKPKSEEARPVATGIVLLPKIW